jgi:hypothetical protein
MLFGGCNCVPGSSFLSAYGSLCADGAGFVSAMIGAMVAGARTASAPKLGREVPEVDRLAVRMVTDNIVIQFVPPERHGGIEAGSGGIGRKQGARRHRRLPYRAAARRRLHPPDDCSFKEIDPDILIPAHCTGDRFYDLAREAMGGKVVHSAVGMRFVFAG